MLPFATIKKTCKLNGITKQLQVCGHETNLCIKFQLLL